MSVAGRRPPALAMAHGYGLSFPGRIRISIGSGYDAYARGWGLSTENRARKMRAPPVSESGGGGVDAERGQWAGLH